MAEKNMNDFGFYGQKIEFCNSVLISKDHFRAYVGLCTYLFFNFYLFSKKIRVGAEKV